MKTAYVDVLLLRLILGLAILTSGGNAVAATAVRIAVAPFEGDTIGDAGRIPAVADALAARLSDRKLERLISPGNSIAQPLFEPPASEIRRWAFANAVDTIVVGRVVTERQGVEGTPFVIETILRSGHSGAELGRHQIAVARKRDLDEAVEKLASEILEDLGHRQTPVSDPETSTSDASPGVSVGGGAGSAASSSGGALDVALSKSKFRSDTPIEIKADEAEIINRDEGRQLIFKRNVWVRQDNVTLRSDWLEATYRKGESTPRELIAEGHVRIVQDDRRAKCDRAIYQREMNRLTCSGRAELVQGCDIIRGASIEFDLAGDRARVEGAASIVIQPKGNASTTCTTKRGEM